MKKLHLFFMSLISSGLWSQINAPGDFVDAYRLCNASANYYVQLVDAGIIDDCNGANGIGGCNFKSAPNACEHLSSWFIFTPKYSGQFGLRICPETVEKLNYILYANPTQATLQPSNCVVACQGTTSITEINFACTGIGSDPNLPNGSTSADWPVSLINIQAGVNYVLFVRTIQHMQVGSHRFTLSFQGNAVTSHPDLFDNVACQLMATNEVLVSKELTVFPNPFNDLINIKTNLSLEKTEIYDLLGKKVYNQNFSPEIDTAFLESGVYFLKMYAADNEVFVRRIVKK